MSATQSLGALLGYWIGYAILLLSPMIVGIFADALEQDNLAKFRNCRVRDLGEARYDEEAWAAEFELAA